MLDLVKPSRQDVLKEAMEELNARQPLPAPRSVVAVFPAESHMGLIHVENPCVADHHPEDVTVMVQREMEFPDCVVS
jgi:hypothetical protein